MCLFRLKTNRWLDEIMTVIYVPPNSNCPAGLRLFGCIKLLIDKLMTRIVLYIVHAPMTSLRTRVTTNLSLEQNQPSIPFYARDPRAKDLELFIHSATSISKWTALVQKH